MTITHRIYALAAGATIVAAVLVPTMAGAAAPDIGQIGQQYVDETGASNVACSQYDADFICYGLLDGALVAGVYSDGHFTPYEGTAAPTAPTTTAAAADDGDRAGAQEFADMLIGALTPDLVHLCPMLQSDPDGTIDMLTQALSQSQDIIDKAAEFNMPLDDFVDILARTYGNRLVGDCG